MATDRIDIVSSIFRFVVEEIWYKTEMGASFCHVSKISPEDNWMPCVTSGTQK